MPDQMAEYNKQIETWAKLCKDYWRLESKYEVKYANAVLAAKPGYVDASESEFLLKQRAVIAAAGEDVTRLCRCVDRDAARLKLDLLGELIKKSNDANAANPKETDG